MLSNCTDLNFAYVHICVPMKVLYDIIYINYQLMQTLKRINSNNFTYLFIIGYSFILFLLIMRIKRSHIMCRTIKLLKINFMKLFLNTYILVGIRVNTYHILVCCNLIFTCFIFWDSIPSFWNFHCLSFWLSLEFWLWLLLFEMLIKLGHIPGLSSYFGILVSLSPLKIEESSLVVPFHFTSIMGRKFLLAVSRVGQFKVYLHGKSFGDIWFSNPKITIATHKWQCHYGL